MNRFKVFLTACTALGSTLVLAETASAQQASPAAGGSSIEEVVVTARGRSENVQNVPIADTAFSSEQIEDAHIREVGDFINLTPNVSIVQAQSAGYNAITIRGITQVRNSESPVAVVVDGVEEINPYQFAQELFDLQGIEVLKGPQGALYGRDAEGGAILITTKQPTNNFEGHVDLGGASGGEFDTQAVASGPIVKDQLFFRVGVNYIDRNGYFENIYLDKPQDPYRDLTIQGLIKWKPTENFTADLRVSHALTHDGADNYHYQDAVLLPNGLLNPANPFNFAIPGDANLVSDKFNSQFIAIDRRSIDEVSLKLDYDLGFATASSVTAWNHLEDFLGGMAFPYANTNTIQLIPNSNAFNADNAQTQYLDVDARSEEFRLTSNANNKLRWMVGGYYLATDRFISTTTDFNQGLGVAQVERAPAGPGSISPTLSYFADQNHNQALAGFANLDYDLLDNLQLSAAFRYDQDQRTQLVSQYDTGGTPGAVNKATFGQGQPKFTVTYKPRTNFTAYASWGIGFRSGEFNQNGIAQAAAAAGIPGVTDKVPQEKATTEEIGFKSSWFGNHLKLSGDLYQTDVVDQQYFVFLGALGAQILVPLNKVQLRGGELEAQATLMPGLDVFSAVGVTSSKIQAYQVDPADVGKWAPYVPDMTFNAGVQYRTDLITDSVAMVTRADYRLTGKQYWDPENSTARNPLNLVGLSIGLEDDNGAWSASIRADNVLNVKYNAEYVDGGFAQPAPPCVIRGTLRYNF
jgi:iron complex outermembrane receptor protein